MKKLIKIRIPMIVTEDGKWAAQGSHSSTGDPDWSGIDEACDWENPTINPRRYWIETAVELPETETVTAAAIPQ
jgi:hypothetical protein